MIEVDVAISDAQLLSLSWINNLEPESHNSPARSEANYQISHTNNSLLPLAITNSDHESWPCLFSRTRDSQTPLRAMLMQIAVIVSVVLTSTSAVLLWRLTSGKRFAANLASPLGPPSIPIIGNLHQFPKPDFHLAWAERAKVRYHSWSRAPNGHQLTRLSV
jgi:hypothetical protein